MRQYGHAMVSDGSTRGVRVVALAAEALACLLLFVVLILQGGIARAEVYGRSTYGNCAYSADCQTTGSPSPVPSTPPIPSPNASFSIDLNLKPGEVIRMPSISLEARFVSGEEATQVTPDTIGWVSFYANNTLIDTVYSPSSTGTYILPWQPQSGGATTVSVIAFDKEGKALSRKDVDITVVKSAVSSDQRGTASNNQDATSAGIVGAIADGAGKLGAAIPSFAAKTFPLWLFLILLALAVRLWLQTIREISAIYKLQKIIVFEQGLSDQKRQFITLATHYLYTPLTLITGGVEMMEALNPNARTRVETAANNMKSRIDTILEHIRSNSDLRAVQAPTINANHYSPLKSAAFWMPVASVLLVMLIINTLLAASERTDVTITAVWVQLLLVGVAIVFLLLAIRSRAIRATERHNAEQALQHEQAVDKARNYFVSQAATELRKGIDQLSEARITIGNSDATTFFDDGLSRISKITHKLELAGQVQRGAVATQHLTSINLHEFVSGAIAAQQRILTQKNISMHNEAENRVVGNNLVLFGFVVQSLIDNAVKFSKDGGGIWIKTERHGDKTKIIVEDNGIGIASDKQQHIFEPFARGTSIETFDYEGLGFSLYLSKLIVDRLDGEISIQSESNVGTKVTVII